MNYYKKNWHKDDLLMFLDQKRMNQNASKSHNWGSHIFGYNFSGPMKAFALIFMIGKQNEEQCLSFAGKDSVPTYDTQENMPYTLAFIEESLKVTCPVLKLIDHTTKCDVQLGGYGLPKDTIVSLDNVRLDWELERLLLNWYIRVRLWKWSK